MTLRWRIAALLIVAVALSVWRSQLFTVSRPGEKPRPLEIHTAAIRIPSEFDVMLPQVPVGVQRLRGGDGVLVIHYWAPWERHAARQAATLDSLQHLPGFDRARFVVVCFDPFPSLSRYIARQRLRLCVLLDGGHALRRALPCPSIPYTYVLDGAGRIACDQAGEMDWLSPETRAALERLIEEPPAPAPARPAASTGT